MSASPREIDTLWVESLHEFHTGKFAKAATGFERLALEFPPGDSRAAKAHFYLAECYLAQKQNLQAAREFRRVSDETPNDPLAPQALLRAGDAYADLWRRPELDPTYGQTALATYQELLNRYPGSDASKLAQLRIADLQERFAYKTYLAALYYFKFKAYDSAILYLKDLVATYPKTKIAPQALIKLVEAYRVIGYQEDLRETCGYLRRFHPDTPHADEVCPRDAPGTS
jgi:outer membrane protein assembly factor BamD